MSIEVYTAITFAPVQSFIENSRKLRDLYGSSYILSSLAHSICIEADNELHVISPAPLNIAQGTPNQILIQGNLSQPTAQDTFNQSWKQILQACQTWIEQTVVHQWQWNQETQTYDQTATPWQYRWDREWKLCATHAWEFFWAQGPTAHQAKTNLFTKKRSRNWTGINWTGESSTLSGADALALPSAGTYHPKQGSLREQDTESKAFFAQLSFAIGKAFIDNILDQLRQNRDQAIARYGRGFIYFVEGTFKHPDKETKKNELYQTYGAAILDPTEQLSIPELAKRLITLEAIAQPLQIALQDIPETYRSLNRLPQKQNDPTKRRWTGWFLGDGDQASLYLRDLSDPEITAFSQELLNWGEHILKQNFNDNLGRIIYAGGDDFLGVFYRNADDKTESAEFINPVLQPHECLNWFYQFRSGKPTDLWTQKNITVSVGFVWAAPNVPQREVLQHCRIAEHNAKQAGRDRLALRILFNDGQYLEWICPWRFLPVLADYRDRNGNPGTQNWTHLFNDIAVLSARHAFQGKDDKGNPCDNNLEVAIALFQIYFPTASKTSDRSRWNSTHQNVFDPLMHSNPQDCNTLAWWQQPALWTTFALNGQIADVGLLGDPSHYLDEKGRFAIADAKAALTEWIINLAKIGFHLCSNI